MNERPPFANPRTQRIGWCEQCTSKPKGRFLRINALSQAQDQMAKFMGKIQPLALTRQPAAGHHTRGQDGVFAITRHRRHPTYVKPVLLATMPNQVWRWDITLLRGPRPGNWYRLYVVVDIFSRKKEETATIGHDWS
jgi:transposase InsO family protein